MKTFRCLLIWLFITLLIGGNIYQGREPLYDFCSWVLGKNVDEPINPDSAQAMRSALNGMEVRLQKIQAENASERKSDRAVISALREEVALYKSFADDARSEVEAMQLKVDEANKRSTTAGGAIHNIVKELIRLKVLEDHWITVH